MTAWLPARFHSRLPSGKVLVEVTPDDQPIPEDKPFVVRVRRPRNPKHHRLYWALLGEVVNATGRWVSPESLHRWLKIELEMYEIVGMQDGRTMIEFDSTDFVGMDQTKFERFFDLAIAAISMETGIDPTALRQEVHE